MEFPRFGASIFPLSFWFFFNLGDGNMTLFRPIIFPSCFYFDTFL